MKIIKKYRTCFGILSTTFLFAACGASRSSVQTYKMPLIPEIIGSTATRSFISNDKKDTSISTIEYEFYSTPKSAWQDSVNFQIGKFTWSTTTVEEEPYVAQAMTHEYFQNRLISLEKEFHKNEDGSEYPMMWQATIENKIQDSLQDFILLRQATDTYAGGAHPNYFLFYRMISKISGKTMLLKDCISDVTTFNKIAENYFRKAAEIEPNDPLEDIFFFENNEFSTNDNFYFTAEGLTMIFNVYEFAPYAVGTIVFTVPMDEIKSLLKIDLKPKS